MGQLDAIQKCAHAELSRKKAPKRYTFTLECLTCEIGEHTAQWARDALHFLGYHAGHRTWITARESDTEPRQVDRSRGLKARILDLLKVSGVGMTIDEIADDQDTESELVRIQLLKLLKAKLVTLRSADDRDEALWHAVKQGGLLLSNSKGTSIPL